jgi:hypothetical protein
MRREPRQAYTWAVALAWSNRFDPARGIITITTCTTGTLCLAAIEKRSRLLHATN